MGESFYIFKDGELRRKDDNVQITTLQGEKKILKTEVAEEIYLFGEISTNSKLLNYVAQKKILLHFFNYYGFYSGSFIPRESNISGYLLVKQVNSFEDNDKRRIIAREILESAAYNIYRNLRYYNGRGYNLNDVIRKINDYRKRFEYCKSIQELMGVEGNIRKTYYSSWNDIVKQDISFTKRIKRPPDNLINSLLSFVNSLMYTTVLSEIYKTQLNPTISFLHEPGVKRFSLSLDLAEIFKPIIGERMIFSLLNKNQITQDDFVKKSNYLYIKESGKKKILMEYDKRLNSTIKHRELGRHVSYRYLIRLECYKLIKHIIGEKKYEGFKIWW